MPYISMRTSKKLSDAQKEAVKSGFGKLISIIPTKSESGLMVDISDSSTFFFRGELADAAYINIKMLGTAERDVKEELTTEIFKMLNEATGLEIPNIYLSYGEYPVWGSRGTLNPQK